MLVSKNDLEYRRNSRMVDSGADELYRTKTTKELLLPTTLNTEQRLAGLVGFKVQYWHLVDNNASLGGVDAFIWDVRFPDGAAPPEVFDFDPERENIADIAFQSTTESNLMVLLCDVSVSIFMGTDAKTDRDCLILSDFTDRKAILDIYKSAHRQGPSRTKSMLRNHLKVVK